MKLKKYIGLLVLLGLGLIENKIIVKASSDALITFNYASSSSNDTISKGSYYTIPSNNQTLSSHDLDYYTSNEYGTGTKYYVGKSYLIEDDLTLYAKVNDCFFHQDNETVYERVLLDNCKELENTTYYLDNNLALENNLEIKANILPSICLNGYILDMNSYSIDFIGNKVEDSLLTISNCKDNGYIKSSSSFNISNAKLYLKNVDVKNSNSNFTFINLNNASLALNNVNIKDNSFASLIDANSSSLIHAFPF